MNQFDKYGRQMGNVGWRGRDYIYILTPEKRKKFLEKTKLKNVFAYLLI